MAKWGKTEVRRIIAAELAPVVAPTGFRCNGRAEAFVRKIVVGRQELGLSLVDYNPVFEFSLNLCVRLDAVQEIMNRFSGSPPTYHGQTMTSITHLEFLGLPAKPGRGVHYRVKSEAELLALLPLVLQTVRQRVLPFFEEYCDIEAVNRGINPVGTEHLFELSEPPDRRSFDATNQPYRAMTGVTVAFLAHDPRLPELTAAYRSQLRDARHEDRTKLESLLDYLRRQTHSD